MTENSSLVIHSMQDVAQAAKAMAASGYFQDAKEMAQAAVKVMAGHEMGFGPFASMTGIHIISGKPAIGSNLIAAAIKKHPMYNYRVRKHTDTECVIEFFELFGGKWELTGESSFSMADAQTAGLTNNPTWKKFPRNMVFSRAISNGARWYCPDIFGGAPTYTPEELGAVEDEDGYVTVMPEPVEEQPAGQQAGKVAQPVQHETSEQHQDLTAEQTETVERLITSLQSAGNREYTANDPQRNLLRHVIDDVVFNDANAHHMILKVVFGNPSVKEITGGQTKAILDWLKPVKDSSGEYTTDKGKQLKALMRYAEVADGQMMLFEQPAMADA